MRGNECSSTRIRARATAGGIAAFWTGTLVAGALAPGYSARADYISSLAGRGSEVALIGVATLAMLGLSHLLAAAALRGPVRVPLALAGLAGLVVAAFRTGCPLGAAGCGFGANDTVPDLADTVHPLAVVAYEATLIVAMGVVAAGAVRARRPVWGVLTVAAAVASVFLVLQVGGAENGWWQRGWLVVNTGWLVVLVITARHRPSQVRPGAAPPSSRAGTGS